MYRTVDTSLFYDPKIRAIRKDQPLAVYLFLYLFQNSHTHLSGIYHISKAIICDETGISDRVYDTLCHTLSEVGLVKFDQKLEVVYVKRMFKYQGKGEKNEKAAANQLESLHNCYLIKDFLDDYPKIKDLVSDTLYDRVSIGYPTEQNRNRTETEQKKEGGSKDPSPPSNNCHKEKTLIVEWNLCFKDEPLLLKKPISTDSKSRLAKCKLRLNEHPDLSWWREVYSEIKKSNFCKGENPRGWRVTFDWLVDNDKNALKVYEKNFENGISKNKETMAERYMREKGLTEEEIKEGKRKDGRSIFS